MEEKRREGTTWGREGERERHVGYKEKGHDNVILQPAG